LNEKTRQPERRQEEQMKKFFGKFLCTKEEIENLTGAAEREKKAYVIMNRDSESMLKRDHADELARVKRECDDKIAGQRIQHRGDIAAREEDMAELRSKKAELEKTMHLDIEHAKLQLTKEIGMELMKVREELSAARENAESKRINYNDHLEFIKRENVALVAMNKDLLDKYAQLTERKVEVVVPAPAAAAQVHVVPVNGAVCLKEK
jgi:hypothetical protein